MNAINVNQSRWERIPLKEQRNFIWEKETNVGGALLIKSSCFTVIFFRALSLTLPFHYLCCSKNSPLLYLVATSSFPLHCHSPYSSREKKRESTACPVFSDNPLVVVGEKRGVHGCQIALKTPWKIDLQHFSGPWHYLEGSWIGNLWAGDGIKMSSLLEKKENCPFSPSPSSPKNRQERKKHRGLWL